MFFSQLQLRVSSSNRRKHFIGQVFGVRLHLVYTPIVFCCSYILYYYYYLETIYYSIPRYETCHASGKTMQSGRKKPIYTINRQYEQQR